MPGDLEDVGEAVAAAARAADATYVDPIADGWFSEPAGLIASDGISPTNAGHSYIAGLIAPVVQRAAGAASTPAG